MKTMKSPGIGNRWLALSLGACLLTGCVSQEDRGPEAGTAEGQTGKNAKAVVSSDQVPAAVKQALQVKFPNVRVAEWKLKAEKIYEAEFTSKGTEITVMFDPTGNWLETESAIDPRKVPQAVSDAGARQFKGYKVIENQSVERRGEPQLIYELHFENVKEIAKVQFSSEGAILSQSAKPKP